ncbi:type II toxin-antitoxin system RelB/DinJ family antitoxin [Cloacibacillus porcorum]|jgi:DNA-damage-inducible protein J|uniref:Damage-inducible protein J n=1 Tax=Cloacibacillus porcorum TaxID=1197717 RepID=A0A1B2I2N8_9BACT|nr:type II toxin-antitoxin system RelB/DinJ family antitoxin [Cloacibacillus porcorum]ANZ44238.1 damage-inducible protein J [Cloacibacillus porcorum]
MPLATMSIRVEEETKREIEAFCADVGMNPSTAVNLFFKAMLRENRLPFEISRDPFYSEANMRHLRESVAQMNAGKITRHELIPCDE